ncbi:IS3 family transposase [Listeria booriae]|nr:IS3 family transposase [Listeria booriae]MBC2370372.1 IS3 family transposase [Listeria booriae]
MGTRVAYPLQVKQEAIEMKLAGKTVKEIMETLHIKNKTQVETWWRWYRNGEEHRLFQPVGKQYTFGKGPEVLPELEQLRIDNKFLRQQLGIPKKVQRIGKEVEPQLFVALVESKRGEMTVKELCEMFQISRSSYYRWVKQKDKKKWSELACLINRLCVENKFRYGYRKITALVNRTHRVSKNTVQKIMQKYGWSCRVKKKKRQKTGQPYAIYANQLNRQFQSDRPLTKLVTDITYLPFGQKLLYLSSIMDLYNGEIIAYTIDDKQDVALVLDTLHQLPPMSQCLMHSDQGSVYTSYSYQEEIKRKSITMSMSRKGTPADNACIESFHASLKSETFYLDGLKNESTSIVIQTVVDYISYYNKNRIQQKLDYRSPIEYRQAAV